MKREFKFRCWNENIAVPGSNEFMEYSDEIGLRKFFERYPINGIVMRGIAHRHIMQFTGLHDKNGKEIYEGDILKVTRVNLILVDKEQTIENNVLIFWDAKKCSFRHSIYDKGMLKSTGGFPINDDRAEKTIIEVIGNIYENPELL